MFNTYCSSQNIYLEINIVLESDWIVPVDFFWSFYGTVEKSHCKYEVHVILFFLLSS